MADSVRMDMEMFTLSNIIAYVLFGLIGWYAFRYGRKQEQWKTLVLGIALMIYPYFISGTVWLYTVGILLTGALFIFHD